MSPEVYPLPLDNRLNAGYNALIMSDVQQHASLTGGFSRPLESLAVQLARSLSERIHEGTLQAGMRLPSEPKLAALFGVSRNTVREAIRILIAQGMLEARHGVGTFVLSDHAPGWPVETGLEELMSTTEMITRAGHVPGCGDYHVEIVPAPGDVALALSLGEDATVYHLSRVRLADDQPVMFCADFLPTTRVSAEMMGQFEGQGSLFSFLAAHCSLRVAVARTAIAPVMPSRRIATALAVTRHEPLLLLKQTHFDPDNQPFLYSENHINPAFMGFHVRRTPPAAGKDSRLRLLSS